MTSCSSLLRTVIVAVTTAAALLALLFSAGPVAFVAADASLAQVGSGSLNPGESDINGLFTLSNFIYALSRDGGACHVISFDTETLSRLSKVTIPGMSPCKAGVQLAKSRLLIASENSVPQFATVDLLSLSVVDATWEPTVSTISGIHVVVAPENTMQVVFADAASPAHLLRYELMKNSTIDELTLNVGEDVTAGVAIGIICLLATSTTAVKIVRVEANPSSPTMSRLGVATGFDSWPVAPHSMALFHGSDWGVFGMLEKDGRVVRFETTTGAQVATSLSNPHYPSGINEAQVQSGIFFGGSYFAVAQGGNIQQWFPGMTSLQLAESHGVNLTNGVALMRLAGPVLGYHGFFIDASTSASIFKVELRPPVQLFEQVQSTTFGGTGDAAGGPALVYRNTFHIAQLGNPGRISSFAVNTFNEAGSVSLLGGESSPSAIFQVGKYGLAVTSTDPMYVVRFDLNTNSRIDAVILEANEGSFGGGAQVGTILVLATYRSTNCKLVRVDGNNMTRIDATPLGATWPNAVVQIDHRVAVNFYLDPSIIAIHDGMDGSHIENVTLNAGESWANTLVVYQKYIYVVTYSTPMKIIKLTHSPLARQSAFTVTGFNSLAAGAAHVFADLIILGTDTTKIVIFNASTDMVVANVSLNGGTFGYPKAFVMFGSQLHVAMSDRYVIKVRVGDVYVAPPPTTIPPTTTTSTTTTTTTTVAPTTSTSTTTTAAPTTSTTACCVSSTDPSTTTGTTAETPPSTTTTVTSATTTAAATTTTTTAAPPTTSTTPPPPPPPTTTTNIGTATTSAPLATATFPALPVGSLPALTTAAAGSGALAGIGSATSLAAALGVLASALSASTNDLITTTFALPYPGLGSFLLRQECLTANDVTAATNTDGTKVDITGYNATLVKKASNDCVAFNPSNEAISRNLLPDKLLSMTALSPLGGTGSVILPLQSLVLNPGPTAISGSNCNTTVVRGSRFRTPMGNVFVHSLGLPMQISVLTEDGFPVPLNLRISTNSSGFAEIRGTINDDVVQAFRFTATDGFKIAQHTCWVTPVFVELTAKRPLLPSLTVHAGEPFQYLIPDDTFISSSQFSIIFVRQSNGFGLPSGISFHPPRTLTGSAKVLGNFSLQIQAADYFAEATSTLMVHSTNTPPRFKTTVADATVVATVGPARSFRRDVALSLLFNDPDGDALQFFIVARTGVTPPWLRFIINPGGFSKNPQTLQLSGDVPATAGDTNFSFEIQCTDGFDTIAKNTSLFVRPAEMPVELKPLPSFVFEPGGNIREQIAIGEFFATPSGEDVLFTTVRVDPNPGSFAQASVLTVGVGQQAVLLTASQEDVSDAVAVVNLNVSTAVPGKFVLAKLQIECKATLWQRIRAYVLGAVAFIGLVTSILGAIYGWPILVNFFRAGSRVIDPCPLNARRPVYKYPQGTYLAEWTFRNTSGTCACVRNCFFKCISQYVYDQFSLQAWPSGSPPEWLKVLDGRIILNPTVENGKVATIDESWGQCVIRFFDAHQLIIEQFTVSYAEATRGWTEVSYAIAAKEGAGGEQEMMMAGGGGAGGGASPVKIRELESNVHELQDIIKSLLGERQVPSSSQHHQLQQPEQRQELYQSPLVPTSSMSLPRGGPPAAASRYTDDDL